MTDCLYGDMICWETFDQRPECQKCEFNPKNITDPFNPKFDHSKCYFWCGNPYCDSRPKGGKS